MIKDQYVANRNQYMANRNLKELHGSDFEVAHDEPDIRGWKVVNMENIEIGKVNDLLFDIDSRKVRYLAIKLNGKPLNLISRDLLIPIGLAELDKKDDFVLLPDITVGQLASLPDYKKGKVTVETERAIRTVFSGTQNVDKSDHSADENEQFYDKDYFDADRMYRPRRGINKGPDDVVPDDQHA
jgi:sporulation protein YlmC with PRC-barrel domain